MLSSNDGHGSRFSGELARWSGLPDGYVKLGSTSRAGSDVARRRVLASWEDKELIASSRARIDIRSGEGLCLIAGTSV